MCRSRWTSVHCLHGLPTSISLAVEGMLPGLPQSHHHSFHAGSRLWEKSLGTPVAEAVKHHQNDGALRVDEIPPWLPGYLKSLGCCRAVLVDMSLQYCVDVRGDTTGVADSGGGSHLQEGGQEGVFQLTWDHTPRLPP